VQERRYRELVAKELIQLDERVINERFNVADGRGVAMEIFGQSTSYILGYGFIYTNKNTLSIGTEVVVDGYQSKDRSTRANGRDITFPDGKKLFMGSSGTGAPRDGRDPTEPPK